MSGNHKSYLKRIKNLQIAAGMNLTDTDMLFNNLTELLRYRKDIAHDLLRCSDMHSSKYNALDQLYRQVEYDIKSILGI